MEWLRCVHPLMLLCFDLLSSAADEFVEFFVLFGILFEMIKVVGVG